MCGKIKSRKFKSIQSGEVDSKKLPQAVHIKKGITGKDNYGYSSIISGKPNQVD